MSEGEILPVHGFVLAGGKSSRMGEDKALLRFRGKPMVEIAVEKLRSFCAEVSIAGNREDLSGFAEVVRETRVDVGPGAGVEAGLRAARQEWVMFVPVDVPLVPVESLKGWARAVMGSGSKASYLVVEGVRQPTFCMVRREAAERVAAALEGGERRLAEVLRAVGALWEHEVEDGLGVFANVNTPQELVEAEALAGAVEEADPLRG